MVIEPLSQTTIHVRRNLMAASVAAITYKTFNVTIENVSFFGSSTHFDKGAVAFVLIAATGWFTAHFVFRYVIDMKNLELTPHQVATGAAAAEARQAFRHSGQAGLADAVRKALPEDYDLGGWQYPVGDILFQNCERAGFVVGEKLLNLGDKQNSALTIIKLRDPLKTDPLDPRENRELYERPVTVMLDYLRQYQRRYILMCWKQRPVLFSVWSLYAVTNFLIEGLVPIVLGVIALAAMYDFVSLSWLASLLPPSAR